VFLLYQRILEKYLFPQKYVAASRQHIRMISEASCDTEDWRNDAENSALPSQ